MISNQDYIIQTQNFRITFFSPCLFRVETKNYTDEFTQVIINRDIHERFLIDVKVVKDGYEFITNKIKLVINHHGQVLSITLIEENKTLYEFKNGNLKGTARTLDWVDGEVLLEDGIISKNGVAILDDSKSLLVINNQLFSRKDCKDLYYFAYGKNYRQAIKAFYKLSGDVPLIPRYALGNWWSRYHAYSDQEYQNLILKFEKNEIPLSVSVIDMDWHYVDIAKQFYNKDVDLSNHDYYDGWTGYTWNKELFPNYKDFLNFLHHHNLKVTLNVHPACGVRDYEEMFDKMAKAMEIDPSSTHIIPFDITNPKFIENYLKVIHHSYEEDGVDFWWIDWQQGNKTSMKDLDPLWALNHYHYNDNNRLNHRPLILSRYSGAGSHRYPLGFSGDTYISWKCLKFQPYFTLTSANIGYVWWSHDIGGHMAGIKDNELYIRWLQLGVFSPINRLHSTSNAFTGKEPWKYITSIKQIAIYFLQFRKRLIPYLYSMNYQTYKNGRALVEPMYYSYSQKEAYMVKNQFMFGSELMVSPITSKANLITLKGNTKTFIPKGRWTDIFTNQIYEGEQVLNLYRDLSSIPVLAKEGAIIPLYKDGKTNNIDNNQDLEILVYRGNNEFELYEDDGESKKYNDGEFSIKKLIVQEDNDEVKFVIKKNNNFLCQMQFTRKLIISFKDICNAKIKVNKPYKEINNEYIQIEVEDINEDIIIELNHCEFLKNKEIKEAMIDLISTYQMDNDLKNEKFSPILANLNEKLDVAKSLSGPIEELKKLKY